MLEILSVLGAAAVVTAVAFYVGYRLAFRQGWVVKDLPETIERAYIQGLADNIALSHLASNAANTNPTLAMDDLTVHLVLGPLDGATVRTPRTQTPDGYPRRVLVILDGNHQGYYNRLEGNIYQWDPEAVV